MAKEFGPTLKDKNTRVAIECHNLAANSGMSKAKSVTVTSHARKLRIGNLAGLIFLVVGLVVRSR